MPEHRHADEAVTVEHQHDGQQHEVIDDFYREPGLHDPIMDLQRLAGNRAVSALLRSSGIPLDSNTRARMESHFATDFSGVRLHTGPDAAHSAQTLNAVAYTVGEDIVLRSDYFTPGSLIGDSLLAHELAHVVQQRHAGTFSAVSQPGDPSEHSANQAANAFSSGIDGGLASGGLASSGSVPAVQRQTRAEADELRHRADIDSLRASLTEAFYSSPQYSNTQILLYQAETLNQYFQESFDEELPRTRVAAARALIGHYEELKRREATADRDEDDQALLYSDIAGMHPWAANRPTRVEDIPIFNESNVFAWFVHGGPAVQAEMEAREGSQRGRQQPRPAPVPPQADGTPLTITDEEIEQARVSTVIGSGLQRQEMSPSERAAGQSVGGSQEVQSGINALRQTNIGQAYAAIVQRLNQSDDENHEARVVQDGGDRSLLDATGAIWYVTNRLFALDRTGHIIPGDFSFYLRGGSIQPGVYFFSPFEFDTNGRRYSHNVLLRVGSGVEVAAGNLFARSIITDFIPLVEQRQQAFARNTGVGVIISASYGERRTFGDLDPGKMWDAMMRSLDHMEWAVRSELVRIIENPAQEAFSQVLSLAMAQVGKMIPHVRVAMTMYQALRLAEWLGTTAGIAAYGNRDEIDIAAQSIARKIVDFTIGQLISKGVSLAGRAGRSAYRSTRRGDSSGDSGQRQLPAETPRRDALSNQQGETRTPGTPANQARPADTPPPPGSTTTREPVTGPANRSRTPAPTRQPARSQGSSDLSRVARGAPVTQRGGRLYHGDREVIVDQHGVVRYADTGRISPACNPQYYELRDGRWRRREGVEVPGTNTRRRVDRPTMPNARTAPRLPDGSLRSWREPLRGDAAAEQRRIMELARTNPQEAGRRYEDLVARDFQGGPEVQNRFRREGRRMDVGNRHEVTIEGRDGPFGSNKLDQLWLDLRDNRQIMLTMPRISDAARTQLSILGAQAQEAFGHDVLILIRLTE